MKRKITIYRDNIWAGTGTIDDDDEIECSAVLGETQEESNYTYEEITDVIGEEEGSTGSINRPDGTYSWDIE